MTDHDLLARYARENSQAAFAELVARHLNLVYSAARRQVPHLADDIAQSVFLDLARHARDFPADQPLAAWLHVVTRRTAVDTIRREFRRAARETAAAQLAATAAMPPSSPSPWSAIAPHVDEAVAALPDTDRTAILLRYFENKSLREIGAALGTTDDAAQKRVSRALDQLRTALTRRGLTVTAAGLATDLSAHAILTAPAALAGAIATATAALGTTTGVAVTVETFRLLSMTTLQKSVSVAALLAVAGVGIYQTRLVSQNSSDLIALRAENDRANLALRDLRLARATTATKLAEVERRIDARLSQPPPLDPADAALESQMQLWLAQVVRLREFLAQRSEWDIPELQLLPEQHWFEAAEGAPFESEEQLRRATARLRDRAVSLAASKISKALNAYVHAHDGLLPNRPDELAPHFDPPLAPAILARYEMLQTGKAADVPRREAMRMLAPKAPADVEFDAYSYIGTNGHGNSGVAMSTNLREAQRKFAQAHEGRIATAADELLPYLKWPVSAAALQKHLDPEPTPQKP